MNITDLHNTAASSSNSGEFDLFTLIGSPDDWESEEQQRGYYQRALVVLEQYHSCMRELSVVELELKEWEPINWEDVFHPEDALRGVRYDKERVQTSGISNEAEQLYIAAEAKIEKNNRLREVLLREKKKLCKKMDFSYRMRDILRGKTRAVADCFWFGKVEMRWSDVEVETGLAHSTVCREKNKAIDEVAKYLKRRDYRNIHEWYR